MAVNHGQRFHSPTSFDTSNVLVKLVIFAPPGGFEPPSSVKEPVPQDRCPTRSSLV